MTVIQYSVLILIGLASGFAVASGIFAFITMLGIIPRLAARTKTANHVVWYETMIIAGGAFGNIWIVFELPMVSVVLNWLGLLKVSWMKAGRRVVIVVIFVIAALITPPDIVSQITVAIPVILLYEFSIFLCTVCEKIGRKKEDTKEEERE